MSGMNSWLAEIYGTNGSEDLEKTAQTHLLQKLAAENNLDLSQFSPEELQELLQEVMGEQSPAELAQQGQQVPQMGQQAAPQGMAPQGAFAPPAARPQAPVHPSVTQAFGAQGAQPQAPQGFNPQMAQQAAPQQDAAALQKEAQAKFEEADLLGRVMAHAYTQELEKIAASRGGEIGKSVGRKVNAFAGHHAKKLIGGAAAGGFAAGRMSKKEKTASAFEKLAEMHAADILSASGFDPSTGQDTFAQPQQEVQAQAPAAQQQQVQTEQQQAGGVVQPGQPQSAEAGEGFAQALDQRSLEMLADAGYDVNEILARLQLASQQQGQA